MMDASLERVNELIEYLDAVGDTCFVIGGRRLYTDDLRSLAKPLPIDEGLVERLIEALKPFARCPTQGKHGGRFVIAHAVYEDMTKGVSAPREAYWHLSDFDNARAAIEVMLGGR